MKLFVKKIHDKAVIPSYAHLGDAGLDLFSVDNCAIGPGHRTLIHTGIMIILPENTEAQIRPRSGLALNSGITVLNTPGTIDEGYRGEIGVILINHGDTEFKVIEGMKIAQMVIKPVIYVTIEETKDVDDTNRGTAGFGSSGI